MNLLVKFPTRGRAKKFLDVFENRYIAYAKTEPTFLITMDHDDKDTPVVHRALVSIQRKYGGVIIVGVGSHKSKIEACNSGIDLIPTTWDVVMLASDDMIPIVEGYDQIILDDMQKHFPDTDGCLWYNDGNCTDLNTLSILGRKYYERVGYLYHRDFFSLWADNLHQHMATTMGKMVHLDQVIIAHAWQKWTGKDALHEVNSTDEVFYRDKATFERLRALPIESLLLGKQ